MSRLLFLEQEGTELRAENTKIMRKGTLLRHQVQLVKGVSADEAHELGVGDLNAIEARPRTATAPTRRISTTAERRARRLYVCSVCRRPGYRANKCLLRVY